MITNPMTSDIGISGVQIDPQSVAPGSVNTGGVDMKQFIRALFVLNVGTFGALATVDMKLQESDDPTFVAGTSDITGFAITTLAAAGGNNRLATIEIRAEQRSKRYVRAQVTVGAAATLLQCLVLGGNTNFGVASDYDVAAVAQRKTVAGSVRVYHSDSLLVRDL